MGQQGMRQVFGSAGAGASWRALGLKTAGAHSTRSLKISGGVQKVMSQRSAGSCTRYTRANAFPAQSRLAVRNGQKSDLGNRGG